MIYKDVYEATSFSGLLQADGHVMPLIFSIRISHSGEILFEFGDLPLNQKSSFICERFHNDDSEFQFFTLIGQADDGTEFKTEDLYFHSISKEWSKGHDWIIKMVGGCYCAKIHRDLLEGTLLPFLRIHLKGFQNFSRLTNQCSLGTIVMNGAKSIDDSNTITGYIEVHPDMQPLDLPKWHSDAEKLVEHVRRIMSFASAATLQNPITEYNSGNTFEITVYSQSKHLPTHLRVFHYVNQQSIYDAAVKSYFEISFRDKNLYFAIEWFCMPTTYSEVRLINAMTALEFIVDSNLPKNESLIQSNHKFKKIKNEISLVIEDILINRSSENSIDASKVVNSYKEKLAELNRRTIYQKIKTLAQLWSVPLDGISDALIKEAKSARDRIVHRGKYYEEEDGKIVDLWTHVNVIREIVIRFVLTAINFNGSYYSYLGTCHEVQFPPPVPAAIRSNETTENL